MNPERGEELRPPTQPGSPGGCVGRGNVHKGLLGRPGLSGVSHEGIMARACLLLGPALPVGASLGAPGCHSGRRMTPAARPARSSRMRGVSWSRELCTGQGDSVSPNPQCPSCFAGCTAPRMVEMAQHLTGAPPNDPDVLPPGQQTLPSSLLGACLSTGETSSLGSPPGVLLEPHLCTCPGTDSLHSDPSDL